MTIKAAVFHSQIFLQEHQQLTQLTQQYQSPLPKNKINQPKMQCAKLIIVSIMAICATALPQQSVTGCTTVMVNGVPVQACGTANGVGSSTSTSISGEGAANGVINADIPDFGHITLQGAVNGRGNANENNAYAEGAAAGTVVGPNGIYASGALNGNAGADFNAGTGFANGALDGVASANGYTFNGAAAGSVAGNLNGTVSGNGAINGCVTQPDGTKKCYNTQGQFAGVITSDGQFIPSNPTSTSSSGPTMHPTMTPTMVPTMTPTPTPPISGANSLAAGSLAIGAGLVALLV